jgi:hypothetical protein
VARLLPHRDGRCREIIRVSEAPDGNGERRPCTKAGNVCHPYHAPIGRSGLNRPMTDDWRGGYWGYFRRAWDDAARRFMTRSGTLRQPITALRKDYSITSSVSASSGGGIVRPSALAVLRLIISSNLFVWTTGKSPGCSPFRILPV